MQWVAGAAAALRSFVPAENARRFRRALGVDDDEVRSRLTGDDGRAAVLAATVGAVPRSVRTGVGADLFAELAAEADHEQENGDDEDDAEHSPVPVFIVPEEKPSIATTMIIAAHL